MPCLYPRPKEQAFIHGTTKSFQSDESALDMAPDVDRAGSVFEALPPMTEGLEPVTLAANHRPQTVLLTELPCPTPRRPEFRNEISRPAVSRSKSEGIAYRNKDNKTLKGKRKRSQTFNISGPSQLVRNPTADPKLAFPLTYPSPSRQRPGNLTLDRRGLDSESERPLTAPTTQGSPRSKESFPLRTDSFQVGNCAWRLAPLPPMPALQIDGGNKVGSETSTAPVKRKPVPLRIRGSSDPAPASPRMDGLYHDTPSYPIGFAVEMPGSLPPVARRSPVELAAAVAMTPDSPLADLHTMALEAAAHTALSSLPSSPTSPIYAHRLSEGARDLLNFFPTTPKIGLSRANSTKSVKSVKSMRRPASVEPPLSPRLVEFAETRKLPIVATTIISKHSGVKVQEIEIKPLSITKKAVHERNVPSPGAISPRTQVPASLINATPPLASAKLYEGRSLPPTPETAGYSRGRFISLAAGLEGHPS